MKFFESLNLFEDIIEESTPESVARILNRNYLNKNGDNLSVNRETIGNLIKFIENEIDENGKIPGYGTVNTPETAEAYATKISNCILNLLGLNQNSYLGVSLYRDFVPLMKVELPKAFTNKYSKEAKLARNKETANQFHNDVMNRTKQSTQKVVNSLNDRNGKIYR